MALYKQEFPSCRYNVIFQSAGLLWTSFYDSNTAKHVLDECDNRVEVYGEQKQELEIAILSVVTKGSKAEVPREVFREMREGEGYPEPFGIRNCPYCGARYTYVE